VISGFRGSAAHRFCRDLRQQLEVSRHTAAAREKAFLDKIQRLEGRNSSFESAKDEEEPALIDMRDDEMSMELATPLPPSTLLPPHHSNDSDLYMDPPSIPLPPSPEPQRSMTPSTDDESLSPLSHTHSDIQLTTLDQLELERELEAANRKLREGEHEYQELQRVVDDLRYQLDQRSPSAAS